MPTQYTTTTEINYGPNCYTIWRNILSIQTIYWANLCHFTKTRTPSI